ncbi:MAG: proton-conducting transporter membrane subunit [Planctomycetia bacterium]
MTSHDVVHWLVILQFAAPAASLVGIGLPSLLGWPPSERFTRRTVGIGFAIGFISGLSMLGLLAVWGFTPEVVHVGTWFAVGHHEATVNLVADALSVPYVCFSTGLCWLVSRFAGAYMHREPGFVRFFVLLALFGTGMNLTVLADSIDVLFAGWECVGLSSALLIGFFLERTNAIRAAMRAYVTYRICDVGLLAASVVVHRAVGSGDFDRLFTPGWPHANCLVPASVATVVSLLVVFAAMGKTAQVPFSGWLPRAMEGPTPSSAIFYGALSIHAGAYVLLRCGPLLDASPAARICLIVIGVGSAAHASVVGRVQTDLKSTLAYASMAQASLILVEIGLGWRVIPLIHVIGHAILRSLQILRSPSALHDRHELEAAIGGHPEIGGGWLLARLPQGMQAALYRIALERGYEEMAVGRLVVAPTIRLLERAAAIEARWVAWLAGEHGGSRR